MAAPETSSDLLQPRRFQVTRYNQRMAQRVARRAKLDEPAVAVAFTFNNLLTMCVFGMVQEITRFVPIIGAYVDMAITLVSFWFHRTLIVTDQHVYVYRDLPFHYPHKQLAAYSREPGLVHLGSPNPSSRISRFIRRGQLTFSDGLVAYHSIIWIRRAQYVEQEGNTPQG
jgi:hypothetical protein